MQRMEPSKKFLRLDRRKRRKLAAENDGGIGHQDKEMTVIFPMILKYGERTRGP